MRGFLAGFLAQYSPGLLCARPLPVFVHELERNVTFHVEHTNRKKKRDGRADHFGVSLAKGLHVVCAIKCIITVA